MSGNDENQPSDWSSKRRGFLKTASATAAGVSVLGGGVNYAVEPVAAASSPRWTENWATDESYNDPCVSFNEATIGNNFGVALLEMGHESVGCDPDEDGDEHWVYRFGVYGIANASAETYDGVEAANWLDGHDVEISADTKVCGSDGPTINSFDSYAMEMYSSDVNDWYDTDHYAEDQTLYDFSDVEYWCNQWESDKSDIDKSGDFDLWDNALSAGGILFGVGGLVTSSYTLGLLSVGTSAVSIVDGFVEYGDRNVEYEDDTTISIHHEPNTQSMVVHYFDFVVDVPPNTSLTVEVNQSALWKDSDKLCGPIDPQSDLNTSECYELYIPSNGEPSQTSDPSEPWVGSCYY